MFMNIFLATFGHYQVIFLQLILALLLGMALGVQRTLSGKNAGMRTYSLVCMGCALLVIIAQTVIASYPNKINFDPLSLAGSVMQGIGFLGAGLIIFHGTKVNGLTTAAGIWISAAIGLAVGYNLYVIAIFATFLTLIVFTLVWAFETKVRARYVHNALPDDTEEDGSSRLTKGM
jgi:putative Mg2+ transporter-C (MgtC) family protein